jgi:hypothetical protein
MTCEYCGTQYKEEANNLIRFETYRNPVQKLCVTTSFPEEAFKESPKEMAEYAIRHTAMKFAECIAPYMVMETNYDPECHARRIYGQIRVVVPKEGSNRWMEGES